MKRIIILIIPILFLTGCVFSSDENIENKTEYIGTEIRIDKDTCIEYIRYKEIGNYGFVLIPRYNQDGTLKLNKQCLINLER